MKAFFVFLSISALAVAIPSPPLNNEEPTHGPKAWKFERRPIHDPNPEQIHDTWFATRLTPDGEFHSWSLPLKVPWLPSHRPDWAEFIYGKAWNKQHLWNTTLKAVENRSWGNEIPYCLHDLTHIRPIAFNLNMGRIAKDLGKIKDCKVKNGMTLVWSMDRIFVEAFYLGREPLQEHTIPCSAIAAAAWWIGMNCMIGQGMTLAHYENDTNREVGVKVHDRRSKFERNKFLLMPSEW